MNELQSLCKAYEKYFKIGATLNAMTVDTHGDIVKQHFNSLTCENEMKYERIQPEEGVFTFEPADKIVAFAKENGIKMRAHAPVWHAQTGEWMYKDGEKFAAKELIYERMEAHTKAMAERYNDAVYCWDVVNEATRDDNTRMPLEMEGTDPVYRNSRYFTLCREEFIEKAFKLMDKYSPNAQLFYNDYDEIIPKKRDRIVALIKMLQNTGCRIDGFGMQQHYFTAPNYDELKRSIEIYAALGLRLHITELDVSIFATLPAGTPRPSMSDPNIAEFIAEYAKESEERCEAICKIYENIFEIYRSYADVIDCVTTWGVADDASWINGFGLAPEMRAIRQYPLLFGRDHAPKSIVKTLIDAAK